MLGRTQKRSPYLLIILDGWGIAPAWGGNAITAARKKTFDLLWKKYPSTSLLASGESVGLPPNAPGNSETGHLNIGAGHIVHQDITLIDQKISDGSFYTNQVLLQTVNHAKTNNSNIHLIGLLSDTGTHSHIRHLFALLEFYKKQNFRNVFIHLFSDGRDSDPMKGIEVVTLVENKIKEIGTGKIASIIGRFYAMDRDNRWERIKTAYDLLVFGKGDISDSASAAFSSAYAQHQTDEFIAPKMVANQFNRKATISNNDAVVFFNFRSDRARELTMAFLDPNIPELKNRKMLSNLFFATFSLNGENHFAHIIFRPENVVCPLAKVISENKLRQLHMAETEKYPHVTYFINGGQQNPFPNEDRIMVTSPKNVRTYDQQPEMSAIPLTGEILSALTKNKHDFYIINFANPDMVGHTGNFNATVKAIECVDECLKAVAEKSLNIGATLFITADHGNAEEMVNPRTGDKDTEHSTNPVPFIIAGDNSKINKIKLRSDGILASLAPTILDLIGIKKPISMRNPSIIINEKAAQ